ncbi:hypothetical protein HPB47_014536 [Ixodes persulcatus]|uniref:Uncharacterized protein n=1 Tax=Ixodes persulcatus TaxID=34615 RepID=A0AC60QYA7_IXOPE|nr:hypothetical protein HPB47_014536 [Ixodes persulcatus]
MSRAQRQSFRAEQKLKIISVAEEIGNRAAGRKYDVDESCIREWRAQKQDLQSASHDRRSFRGPNTGAYPQIEAKLEEFIEEKRGRGHAVSTEMAQVEALRLAREDGIPCD